jgi:DNA-binding response OmpR family regulator
MNEVATPAERPAIKRGRLKIAYDPIEIFVDDIRVPLSPSENAIMDELFRGEAVSNVKLGAALEEIGSAPYHLPLFVYRIRRKFRERAGVAPLRTIHGWGFILEAASA